MRTSTVFILVMFVSVVLYIPIQCFVRMTFDVWLPTEVTVGYYAAFIAEDIQLARIRLAKEGTDIGKHSTNTFLSKIGVSVPDDLEEVAQQINNKNKEVSNVGNNGNNGNTNQPNA